MRVALLSLLDTVAGPDGPMPRGALPFDRRDIAHLQLDIAMALGCERVICLAHGVSAGLIALQRSAEAAGAQFHLAGSARQLAALVRGGDELLVLADGLAPMAQEARPLLAAGHGVLALSADAVADGAFERIDINHCWAGAMLLPGDLAEQLQQLPEDIAVIPALLRIALQHRVPLRLLPDAVLGEGRWFTPGSAEDAARLQRAWVSARVQQADRWSPGEWLAAQAVARGGPALLATPYGSPAVRTGALVVAALACGLIWLGYPVVGLAMMVAGLLGQNLAGMLARIEGPPRGRSARWQRLLDRVFDPLLVLALALCLRADGLAWHFAVFVTLIVVGLTRLLPVLEPAGWARLIRDRSALAALALLAAGWGLLLPVLEAVALLALALALAAGWRAKQ